MHSISAISIQEAGAERSVQETPVERTGTNWVQMIPLLYFAQQGVWWFQNNRLNNALAGTFGSLAHSTGGNLVLDLPVFATIVLLLSSRTKEIVELCRRSRIFVALVVLAAASALWSQTPLRSFEWSICLALNTLYAFYLLRRFKPERLMALLLAFGWISLLASIAMAIFLPSYGVSYLDGRGDWQGLYFHKNFCALTTVFLLPSAFYAPAQTVMSRLLRITYVGLSCFLVYMTQSRTGMLLLASLVLFSLAIRLVRRFAPGDRPIVLLTGSFMAVSVVALVASYWREIVYSVGKDPTLTGRTEIWQAVGASIMKRPLLGYGYMGFWQGFTGESANVSLQNGWAVSSSHNGFLEIWLTLGAIGVILILLSFAKAFAEAAACLLRRSSQYIEWDICIVFLTLVTAMDEEQMMIPNNLMWILYIVAAVGLAEEKRLLHDRSAYELYP
jgi:exopolysaccharide production protein ExoQ